VWVGSGQRVCVSGQWLCDDELSCIPDHLRCNGEMDCFDGSDEQACGQYSFIRSLIHFSHNNTFYIRQVNGVTLAHILFLVLCVCCVTFAETEPYCHSVMFVCRSAPTAGGAAKVKTGRQLVTPNPSHPTVRDRIC